MFEGAFLTGYRNMVEAKADIDRLKCMPQRVENGNLLDFSGRVLIGGLDVEDRIIFDADKVNNAKRYTSALSRDYFIAFDELMSLLPSKGVEEVNATTEIYGADIYDAVSKGDKKGLRVILKEYKKVKWVALNEDAVEDAIDDIKDCVADKDVEGAKEIVTELIGCDICEEADEVKEPQKVAKESTKPSTSNHKPANEDEAELLADLEDALSEKDYEDAEMLLKELGDKHPRYAEFFNALPNNKQDDVDSDEKTDDIDVVDEICLDIDDAIADGDLSAAKKFLEELADEAGTDSKEYKEYEVIVNPPKERKRRSRRGN